MDQITITDTYYTIILPTAGLSLTGKYQAPIYRYPDGTIKLHLNSPRHSYGGSYRDHYIKISSSKIYCNVNGSGDIYTHQAMLNVPSEAVQDLPLCPTLPTDCIDHILSFSAKPKCRLDPIYIEHHTLHLCLRDPIAYMMEKISRREETDFDPIMVIQHLDPQVRDEWLLFSNAMFASFLRQRPLQLRQVIESVMAEEKSS